MNGHLHRSSNPRFNLKNNYNLPLRCSYRPTPSKPLLPNIGSKEDFTADDILRKEAEKGLIDRFETNISSKSHLEINDYKNGVGN